jgi:cobalt-zinc-cadmium resistance protein CzcA
VRGTLAPSTGPTEGIRFADQARVILAAFPEVTMVTSQVGRPDDGTDTTGFFNTEYFVDLKPKEQWRPVFPAGQGRADCRDESGAGSRFRA